MEDFDGKGSITVIKDAGTIITQKNEPITLSPFTIPNLAIAGSGDILSGMIAGECLKKKSPFLATCSAASPGPHPGRIQ